MPKPNEKFTVAQMKDYIRNHSLNKKIRLTQKKADLISALKKEGLWEGSTPKKSTPKPAPKKATPKPTPKKYIPPKARKSVKPSMTDILMNLDIDVSKKIAKQVEENNKVDFYEIQNKNGTFDGEDELKDVKKKFKPHSSKKWIDGITGGLPGLSGDLTRAKAKQIKKQYKLLDIKRFVETDDAPYFKFVDV